MKPNSLAVRCPVLAAEFHPTRNKLLTAGTVSFGSGKICWWICRFCQREFANTPNNRTNLGLGCRCPEARKHRRQEKVSKFGGGAALKPAAGNKISVVRPEWVKEWDWEENGDLTPDTVSYSACRKIRWKCQSGHKFVMTPNYRSNYKSQCPQCRVINDGRITGRRRKTKVYKMLESEYLPSLNNDRPYSSFRFASKVQINWSCVRGHVFKMSLGRRTACVKGKPVPCPKCRELNLCGD